MMAKEHDRRGQDRSMSCLHEVLPSARVAKAERLDRAFLQRISPTKVHGETMYRRDLAHHATQFRWSMLSALDDKSVSNSRNHHYPRSCKIINRVYGYLV